MLAFTPAAARNVTACLAVALLCACSETGPRVYTARLFRRTGCLEPYAALALVQGQKLDARCDPTCLSLDRELYVSSVCAPYPAGASLESPSSAECSAALVAFARNTQCEPSDAAVTDASVTSTSLDRPTDVDAAGPP